MMEWTRAKEALDVCRLRISSAVLFPWLLDTITVMYCAGDVNERWKAQSFRASNSIMLPSLMLQVV